MQYFLVGENGSLVVERVGCDFIWKGDSTGSKWVGFPCNKLKWDLACSAGDSAIVVTRRLSFLRFVPVSGRLLCAELPQELI